jgi:hypothetical protein
MKRGFCMSDNKSVPVRLSEFERALLKSRIEMDVRTSGAIARSAGINAGAMVDALAGNRSINSGLLQALMHSIDIDDKWNLRPDVAHFLKLSADLSPLLPILERLKSPALWWLAPLFVPRKLDMEHQALKSYFFIRSDDGHLLIIDRDPWRIGKGKKAVIAPGDGLPLTPSYINCLRWGGGSVDASELKPLPKVRTHLGDIFNKDAKVPDKNDLLRMIFNEECSSDEVSWNEVISFSSSSGISPHEVLMLLKKVKPNTDHNHKK